MIVALVYTVPDVDRFKINEQKMITCYQFNLLNGDQSTHVDVSNVCILMWVDKYFILHLIDEEAKDQ